jgi:hypothetical protein
MVRDQRGLSEIKGAVPVPPPRESREQNDNPEWKEETTGTSAERESRLPSVVVIGSRSIIVTTLTYSRKRLRSARLGHA